MTYYEILGVSQSASQKEIKSAYKQLIKKYHPDIYSGDKNFAENKTKEINEAYDILSDTDKRRDYDLSITPTTHTPNYNYTPPKYSSNYNPYFSYSNYRNNYSSKYNNYNNYNIHNYNNVDKREVIYDEIAKKLGANISVILVMFVLYLIIFIATLLQFKSYKEKENFNNLISTNTFINNDDYDNNREFNINDYISDDELLQIYNHYYKSSFDSFEEFKKELSTYIENYYWFWTFIYMSFFIFYVQIYFFRI